MRDDVAIRHVRAEFDLHRHRGPSGTPSLVATNRKGAWVVKASCKQVSHGPGEHIGAVEVEQLSRTSRHESEVAPVVHPYRVERIHTRHLREQLIPGFGNPCRTLLLKEFATVLGVFDALMFAPVAIVLSDDILSVEQANRSVARGRA